MSCESIERGFRTGKAGKARRARGGMVSAAFPEAARAGAAILEGGGNAADAAVATALALTVCEPAACGVGGQTLALVHMEGRTLTLDGSGPVPSRFPGHGAQGEGASGRAPEVEPIGYRATTVPTTLATLAWMHRRWGRLPWREVVRPAVEIAQRGYRITALQERLQLREMALFEAVPGQSGVRYFLKGPGTPWAPGDLFRQPELGALLEGVAEEGVEYFYTGDPASSVDADMRRHGGYLRAGDLAAIPWPVERGVVETRFRGRSVLMTPPPMGGRHLAFILNAMEKEAPGFLAGGGGRRTASWPSSSARHCATVWRTRRPPTATIPVRTPSWPGARVPSSREAPAREATPEPGRPPISRSWMPRGTPWGSPSR